MENIKIKTNKLASKLRFCLFIIQLLTLFNITHAQVTEETLSPVMITTPRELEYIYDLSLRIMINKKVYEYINDSIIKIAQESDLNSPKKYLISQTKLIFLLSQIPNEHQKIEEILRALKEYNNSESANKDFAQKMALEELDKLLSKLSGNKNILNKISSKVSYEQPLFIYGAEETSNGRKVKKAAFNFLEEFNNHPRIENPDDLKSKLVAPDDHKATMIKMVNEAKPGDKIYFNFYDLDIVELAEEILAAKNRGVFVMGGIDKKVYEDKATVKTLIDKLNSKEKIVELVDSTGLNHQKLLTVISAEGVSKSLFSSGNATQSCSGPEGDLMDVPKSLRPERAIPNPNNMTYAEGELPAVIVMSEIKKNIVYKLRGQTAFPIGGAFELKGPWDPEMKSRESMLMAFSPNGGLGNIGKDIYAKVIRTAVDRIEGGFFSFSSKSNLDDVFAAVFRIIEKRRSENRPATDIVRFIGDAQFALREFSNLLALSGYKLVEFEPNDPFKVTQGNQSNSDPEGMKARSDNQVTKKVYIKDETDPRVQKLRSMLSKDEWKNWLDSIRVTPPWFSGGKVSYDGKDYPWQVKMHHKTIIIPELNLSNPGSSINFSEAGESNQEQIIIVISRKITQKLRGAIAYLWHHLAGPENSVAREVMRRNKKFSLEEIKLAYEVDKFRMDSAKNFQCLKSYGISR